MSELKSQMAYMAFHPECGCVLQIMLDTPERREDNAHEIADCIREGLTVQRLTAYEARAHFGYKVECTRHSNGKRDLPISQKILPGF